MNTITKRWPTTFRKAAEEAGHAGMRVSDYLIELEKELGPCPMPPAGYTLAPGSDDRWVGAENVHSKWIITPVWNSTTNTHSLDVWLAEHRPPTYAELSTADAVDLAAALITAARSRTATSLEEN